MASEASKPGHVGISIVWVPADWEQPPVEGGQNTFGLAATDEHLLSRVTLQVPAGQPVQQCLDEQLCGSAQNSLSDRSHGVSIWGRRITATQKIQAGDRIELLGPISADPKSDRRARVKQQRRGKSRGWWRA